MADAGDPPVSRAADEAAQVEQIRQRLAKVARGDDGSYWEGTTTADPTVLALWTRYGSSVADVIANFDADRADDLAFIAHAPADVAFLLSALGASQQARQQAEARVRALEQELATWKVCMNCGEPLRGPGICDKAVTESEKGLELMFEQALTRAEKAEAHLTAQGTTLARLREALKPFAALVHPDGVDAPYPTEEWTPILSEAKDALDAAEAEAPQRQQKDNEQP